MAVTSETPIASSVANGVTTVFPHSFTVLDDGDLVVTGTVSNVTTTYTLGVDYTVSGVGSTSGSVTFVTPPASGTIVTRYRDIALTRETDYQDNGDLLADVLNADMDRLVFMLQDIFNGGKVVPTCVRAPNGETLIALPPAASRSGYYLGFDGAGQPVLLAASAGTAAALSGDLSSSSDVLKGDALIGVKRSETGATGTTQHAVNQARPIYPGPDFGAAVDGVTSDTTPLANMTAAGKPFTIPAKAAFQYGAIGPAQGVVNRVDVATIGTTETLSNPTLTGSPATGWTLSNFTSNNPGITHSTGTVGSASQSVTLSAYRMYQVSVTLSTTTEGGITFNVNGVNILDTGVYHRLPVQGSTTYTFAWIASVSGAQTFELLTDASWAGQVTAIRFYQVQDELPLSWVTVPTDDAALRIPYGIKFGRFNAGSIYIGDRLTGNFAGSAATWNVAVGARALWGNVVGMENVAIGAFALQSNLVDRMTAGGYGALKNNTTGIESTAWGYKAAGTTTTASRVNAFGFHCLLQNATGSFNNGFGTQALYNEIAGTYNTAMGERAGLSCRGGTANTYFGALAGVLDNTLTFSYSYGTMIGEETKVFGENGTAVGGQARVGVLGTPVNNSMALGYQAVTLLANTAKIGNGHNSTTISGRVHHKQPFASVTSGVGATYTAAQFTDSRVLTRTGPAGAVSDTTPTAAQIVAAIPGCEVGTGYDLYIRNGAGGLLTLLAGSGVTLSGTTTVAAGNTRHYIVQVNNINAGTEAVTVVGVSTAAS